MSHRRAPLWLLALAATALLTLTTGCPEKKGTGEPAAGKGAEAAPKAGEPAAEPAKTTDGGEAAAEEPAKPAGEEKPAAGEEPAAAGEPVEPVEVVLWHAYRASEKEALQDVVAAYNASQKEVSIRMQGVPYDPFVDKVTITVPRGQGPDLFIFAHNMIGSWVEDGVLEPLSGRIDPAVLKQFMPQSVKALVYRRNLYGLPLAFKSLVLFYNKKLLPRPPDTMEALIEAVKPLQEGDSGVHGFAYEASLLYFHAPWIHAFGGAIFDAEHKPAFDTEAQVKALEFASSLVNVHKVTPKGMSSFMITSLFNQGKVAAGLNGPWFRAEINPDIDYGVATIPTVAGGKPKPLLGIESIFVTTSSEHKDAAIKAAVYLAGEASAKIRVEKGKQPVAHKAVLEAGAAEDPVLKVFMDQAKDAVTMDASPEMQLVWSAADRAITGVIFGGKDAKEELAKAQAKIVEDITKRGK